MYTSLCHYGRRSSISISRKWVDVEAESSLTRLISSIDPVMVSRIGDLWPDMKPATQVPRLYDAEETTLY